jgi:hypothetical protein
MSHVGQQETLSTASYLIFATNPRKTTAPSSAFAYKQSCAQFCVGRCAYNPGKTLCATKCNANCERHRAGVPGWEVFGTHR